MKLSKLILPAIITLSAIAQSANGAAVVTIAITTEGRILQDIGSNALSAGSSSINGDGAAVQVGYYQNSSAANPFGDGVETTFVSLIGQNSVFGLGLTIGDKWENGAGNGEIYNDVEISGRSNGGLSDTAFPAAGVPLVMRFFSAQSLTGATRYEAITSTAWGWANPLAAGIARVEMNFELGTLTAKSGQSISASGTNIRAAAPNPLAVPEPSSVIMLSFVGLLAAARRNRK